MKSTAVTLLAGILTIVAAPSTPFAAKKPGSTGVIVMSRGEVDPTQLKAESYAYVTYRSGGKEEEVWGRIEQIDTDGIAIESKAAPSETRKISFGDIDILAASEDRLSFESWLGARLAAEKITVMTREDLDLTKLATGSYVHVIYTWRGLKRASFGKVLEVVRDGIIVESGTAQTETAKITAAEIDTLAFANSLQAVERWQKWSQRGIVQMSRWDLNPSMLEEGLHVHVVYNSGGARRRAAGRIVDRYTDRIVIQSLVGGKNSFERRQRLEITFDDIETVIVSRDQRARTSDLLRETIIFLHLAH